MKVELIEGGYERIPVNISGLEYHLRDIVVWCRKQIIKLIKDEQVQFDKLSKLDLKT